VAESSRQDAQSLATDAAEAEQQAAAERARLEREAAAAEQKAAQLRSETDTEG
jgi:hypothetical protein